MKDQILKIAGVKSEKEFYKKYPTEAAFKKAHGKALKKAEMGTAMVKKQLTQLTDFSNPPQAQAGAQVGFGDFMTNAQAKLAGMSPEAFKEQQSQAAAQQAAEAAAASKKGGGLESLLGGMDIEALSGMMGRDGLALPKALNGDEVDPYGNITNAMGWGNYQPTTQPATQPATYSKWTGLVGGSKNAAGQEVVTKAATDKAFGAGKLPGGAGGGGISGKLGGIGGALGSIGSLVGSVQSILGRAEKKKELKRGVKVSDVVARAAESRDVDKYRMKPYDPSAQLVQPGQLSNPYGAGTKYFAANGASVGGNPTELQNVYTHNNTLYTDLGYEPLTDSNKQFEKGGKLLKAQSGFDFAGPAGNIGGGIGSMLAGGDFTGSDEANIGSTLGSVAGKFIPIPGADIALSAIGGAIGGAFGAKSAAEMAGLEEDLQSNTERAAWQQGAQALESQFGGNLKNGGPVTDAGWVSNDWQPQVIAKFGDYDVKDLLKPPADADMLRAGGSVGSGIYTPPSAEALQTYEYGGKMAMGGDLQVDRGKAETISYNPFLPEGGETVMFKGPSHAKGGMPIKFGQNGVEVEGGEPAVKLADGGSVDGSLVVFGNMKIDDLAANEIGIDAFKGKKYKHVMNDLSKFEAKQNAVVSKGADLVDISNTSDPFDQLTLNSGRAMMMGGNAKLLNAAIVKQRAAGVQNAILDTAKQLGVKSDALAEGKIVKDSTSNMAKNGIELNKAQNGDSLSAFLKTPFAERKKIAKDLGYTNYSGKDLSQQTKLFDLYTGSKKPSTYSDLLKNTPETLRLDRSATGAYAGGPSVPSFANEITGENDPMWGNTPAQNMLPPAMVSGKRKKPVTPSALAQLPGVPETETKTKSGFGKDLLLGLSSIAPFLRPSNAMPLDPSQLSGEMLALGTNQLEPVQAQTYNPMLDNVYDISLQDQINTIDSQANAAIRAAGQNPAAQAQIMAQAAEAKNKVKGEEFRLNQLNKAQTYGKNRDVLNQAQLQNLQILDQQYVRQAQAKSNTKQQAIAALQSVGSKIAQNKLENKQLQIMENMYNFRFGPNGQAYSLNAPQSFNMEGNGRTNQGAVAPEGYEFVTDIKKKKAETSRNGSIVRSLKSL